MRRATAKEWGGVPMAAAGERGSGECKGKGMGIHRYECTHGTEYITPKSAHHITCIKLLISSKLQCFVFVDIYMNIQSILSISIHQNDYYIL